MEFRYGWIWDREGRQYVVQAELSFHTSTASCAPSPSYVIAVNLYCQSGWI
uniref:Uncharacterized protein n=1 Tax=Moniliophthora roreri TaxID=221103 RepID=A0A0W0GDY7_MONRR